MTINAAPILSLEELQTALEAERAQGKTIISTNGVFDLLHEGHLAYLQASKALSEGDSVLAVALNSDASTARLKGPGRPYNSQMSRAKLLAALKWVDYVTIFEGDTACDVLESIKPSMHTKAGDYTKECMPETQVVEKNGGKIIIIPVEHKTSSTSLVEKIKNTKNKNGFRRPNFVSSSK